MDTLFEHEQWPAVKKICRKLSRKGYIAFIAGGAVRDAILGRDPVDIDIATSATPDQVDEIFNKVVMVGKEFGVCRIVEDEVVVEVATFRSDGPYKDGRRPESVKFTSAKEDAQRRDFTINAMFYDIAGREIIDHVGGLEDLQKGVICTVGNPVKRFTEDKLRVLRGLRFLAQLEFPLERNTAMAMKKLSPELRKVSVERIRDEWEKLLMSSGRIPAIELSQQLGIWKSLFSDWPFLIEEYREVLAEDDELSYEQTWAMWFLLHWRDSKKDLKEQMTKWKLPKDLIQKTLFTLDSWSTIAQFNKMEPVDVALFLNQKWGFFAAEIFPVISYELDLNEWLNGIKRAGKMFKNGVLPERLVSGEDLLAAGMKQGPEMATTLDKIYRFQVANKVTDKNDLLSRVPGSRVPGTF